MQVNIRREWYIIKTDSKGKRLEYIRLINDDSLFTHSISKIRTTLGVNHLRTVRRVKRLSVFPTHYALSLDNHMSSATRRKGLITERITDVLFLPVPYRHLINIKSKHYVINIYRNRNLTDNK